MNFYDVLAAEKLGGGIPTMNFFDLLFAQYMGGGEQWETYEGTLPATLNANGANMRQYQIYGDVGGVGDKTENLFNKNSIEYPAYIRKNGTINQTSGATGYAISDYIPVSAGTYVAHGLQSRGNLPHIAVYDENQELVRTVQIISNQDMALTIASNEKYVRLSVRMAGEEYQTAMFTRGDTAPETFVPFGYELDIGVGEEVDITGLSEPLCGIGTYTDSLNLSTGTLTRRIKKLVLTGTENITNLGNYYNCGVTISSIAWRTAISTVGVGFTASNNGRSLWAIKSNFSAFTTATDFKSYLQQQYAAGTPVTVWYILANPEVSTITVPSGLTGTIEGYLIWGGTPTPETPIYPTANGIKQADDTYSIKYGTSNTTTPIYIGAEPLDKDEYVDYQTQKVYRMINGSLTPTDPPTPLPALPTCDGVTIVEYAGQSVAPEKVLLEYAKGGE